MAASVNRRDWLTAAGLAAGAAVLAPSPLPALRPRSPQRLADFATYHDALLAMEADATAARRAAGPIRLAYNENPFGMSPKAKDAIATGWFEHSQYALASLGTLKAAFAAHVGVDAANVMITQGSSETLSIAALAYGLHGAEIVAPSPTFELLPEYAANLGATVHRVPLTADLAHDFTAMDARITNAVKLVFVCNPNNPTSRLEDGATLRRFVTNAQQRALVIVDEAYHDFVDAPGYRPMIDAVLRGENVILSRTASKIHGIAGLRVGFAIARPDIIRRLQPFVTGNPNGFGMQAAIASIADTSYQSFVKTRTREGRTLLTQTLTALGRRVVPSQTNFVFFHAGRPVEQVQAAMLAKGFLVGRAFPPYLDWCRVSIGTPQEMTDFVAALPEALRV
jgi:histidinol-phosphate aminotransferase